ncbi:hypothetical protein RND81_02G092000 [Saponaria officinalis]|uniref:RING-type E3 ubiquitin transferase n=1 Tax=Saponaria officinalis TaxID=3572 RepID=A0AAW1MSI7_SAPOF
MSPIINTQIANVTNNRSSNKNNNNMMEERYYESIIFSGPIIFALIILFLLYFFYLRRQSVDWSSLRMRQSRTIAVDVVSEVGLKKEFRELLPIIVYKESFSVNDTQCSVCLGDYQAEDRLQQIPGCGHTFHLNCIDHWLATHTTCPLCRLSLVSPSKDPPSSCPENPSMTDNRVNNIQNLDGVLLQTRLQVF